MPRCCAFNCQNIGIHRFPSERKALKAWIEAIRRRNWKPNSSTRLCREHFKPSDYYKESKYTGLKLDRNFLKKDAVPSIFSFSESEKPKSSRALRYEARYEKNEKLNPTNQINYNIPDVAVEVQTETVIEENAHIVTNEINVLTHTHQFTQINVEHIYGSVLSFQDDDQGIRFYTGFESYRKFSLVYATLQPMVEKMNYYTNSVINVSHIDQFFLTIMKLRQNTTIFELSRFFKISTSTASNIFIIWVNFIYQVWSMLDIWPDKKLVHFYMPESFKKYDKSVRVILDGTEFTVQKPENTLAQQASWSNYKHANTLKVLVGGTPGGLLSYCSPAYGGSTSDRQTIERSSLLAKCEQGDTILADRGFNVQDIIVSKEVKVNIPAFLKGKNQLPGLTVLHDRKLASKRIHIERLIGLTKTYKILKRELDHNYIPIASKIFFICFMCCNFREGIVK